MKQGKKSGRGGGIRTHDHLVPNQVRYRAALRPEQRPNSIDHHQIGQAKTVQKGDNWLAKTINALFLNDKKFSIQPGIGVFCKFYPICALAKILNP